MSPLPHAIKNFYGRSQKWYCASFWGRVVIYSVGVLSVFLKSSPPITPLVVAVSSVVFELFLWHANCLRGKAEALKRMDELSDGFGYIIPKTELASIEMGTGDITNLSFPEGLEYHTREEVSPRRALLKLHESSWFSHELSGHAALRLLIIGGLLVGVGFILAIVAPYVSTRSSEIQAYTQIATSIVLSFVSLGLLRRGIELRLFAKFSGETAGKAERMFDDSDLSESTVIRLLTEYQIARSHAPSHGSKIWEKKKKELNRTYQKNFPNKKNE